MFSSPRGAALELVPGTPSLVLDPELALALFVAPVLLDAAFDASPRDLRANWRPVAGLALGAVALTILAVALVVRAVLKQLRPPHRLLVMPARIRIPSYAVWEVAVFVLNVLAFIPYRDLTRSDRTAGRREAGEQEEAKGRNREDR